ncbi:hypothetical protein AB205_0183050, partial [Aquarana catesbeiana]
HCAKRSHCAHQLLPLCQTQPLCPSIVATVPNAATVPINCRHCAKRSHCAHQLSPLCQQTLPLCHEMQPLCPSIVTTVPNVATVPPCLLSARQPNSQAVFSCCPQPCSRCLQVEDNTAIYDVLCHEHHTAMFGIRVPCSSFITCWPCQ